VTTPGSLTATLPSFVTAAAKKTRSGNDNRRTREHRTDPIALELGLVDELRLVIAPGGVEQTVQASSSTPRERLRDAHHQLLRPVRFSSTSRSGG